MLTIRSALMHCVEFEDLFGFYLAAIGRLSPSCGVDDGRLLSSSMGIWVAVASGCLVSAVEDTIYVVGTFRERYLGEIMSQCEDR